MTNRASVPKIFLSLAAMLGLLMAGCGSVAETATSPSTSPVGTGGPPATQPILPDYDELIDRLPDQADLSGWALDGDDEIGTWKAVLLGQECNGSSGMSVLDGRESVTRSFTRGGDAMTITSIRAAQQDSIAFTEAVRSVPGCLIDENQISYAISGNIDDSGGAGLQLETATNFLTVQSLYNTRMMVVVEVSTNQYFDASDIDSLGHVMAQVLFVPG